ncbi:septum site-determining protein MinC [Enterobacteriaceae endosymbiont of Neohaemonia nigricornis]|uniref:septum site-determining protein MinC n=1 Tax=Enterobacteriaceae endosymbiont of Neohaemonia nigricornis TaxID=2675792 RepID=UPI001449CC16|nr:septum site-determining protein MinC [Enterobacteriaceae endosymbiont of Neohaemonia nigricornis]QJC30316.1 septum site-determining protein MinC [Enterobacteriaceae endosymbiont of Neohaemonia nigricornis]
MENNEKLQSLIKIIKQKRSYNNIDNNICYAKSIIINYHIRSGQQIYAKYSDLIVVNNVSNGAELIADGNIHIYGYMRGKALSGANGDKNCQIFCSKLYAELISIAGEYLVKDEIDKQFIGQASRIFLKRNLITIKQLS